VACKQFSCCLNSIYLCIKIKFYLTHIGTQQTPTSEALCAPAFISFREYPDIFAYYTKCQLCLIESSQNIGTEIDAPSSVNDPSDSSSSTKKKIADFNFRCNINKHLQWHKYNIYSPREVEIEKKRVRGTHRHSS